MKSISMSGSVRKSVGGKATKELKANGLVPCVMYGNADPIHFAVDARQFKKLIYTPNVYMVNMNIDGTEYNVFLKAAQFHPVSDEIIHADFFQPEDGQRFELKIPVRVTGNAIGVLNGGRLGLMYRKLRLKGDVNSFPDAVEIDITKLRIGMGVRVSELSVPGCEFLDSANNYVVSVKTARGALDEEEEDEDEEGAEGEAATAEGEAPAAEAPAAAE
ncbi:MAG: 50S ribosomal protein L25 [Crocinitomicaceae bacterium]|nr:50S ribosomal protein L25 [Crocinitomicaceae bacterium]|tara:strand:+ start:9813 stop:10463 length:651 start_codon:yes stop_codon:yes gene_type:complete